MTEERQSMPSRRALIAGAALIPALAVPGAALAETDAELMGIGRQWPVLIAQHEAEWAICRRCEEACADRWSSPPEELRVRRDDHGIGWHRPPTFHDNVSVARLREYVPLWEGEIAAAGGRVGIVNYHRPLARARQVIAAYEAWWASVQRAEDDAGLTASCDRLDAILGELHALSDRVRTIEARTLAGLAVKARISAWQREPADDESRDEQGTLVANSLIRDLLALGA